MSLALKKIMKKFHNYEYFCKVPKLQNSYLGQNDLILLNAESIDFSYTETLKFYK